MGYGASTRAAVGGAVLLAIGFGFGWLVADSRPPEMDIQFRDRPAPPPAPVPAPSPTPLPAAPASADLAALRAALASIPREDAPTGSGTVTGTVKTEGGDPVAGVVVTLTPNDPPRANGEKPWDKMSEEEKVVSYVRGFRRRDAGQRSGASDASGAFRVEGLADALFWHRAEKPGYQVYSRGRGQVRPGDTLDLVAKPVVEVRVELVPHAGSSGTGHEATRCCMKACITSTISSMLPENGVRSQRPV